MSVGGQTSETRCVHAVERCPAAKREKPGQAARHTVTARAEPREAPGRRHAPGGRPQDVAPHWASARGRKAAGAGVDPGGRPPRRDGWRCGTRQRRGPRVRKARNAAELGTLKWLTWRGLGLHEVKRGQRQRQQWQRRPSADGSSGAHRAPPAGAVLSPFTAEGTTGQRGRLTYPRSPGHEGGERDGTPRSRDRGERDRKRATDGQGAAAAAQPQQHQGPGLAVEGRRSPEPLAARADAPPSPGPLLAPRATRVPSDLLEVSLDPVTAGSFTRCPPPAPGLGPSASSKAPTSFTGTAPGTARAPASESQPAGAQPVLHGPAKVSSITGQEKRHFWVIIITMRTHRG